MLIGLAAILPAWGAANAQDSGAAPDSRDVRVRIGLGAQLQPEYLGADGATVSPLFHINTARGDHEFAAGAPDDSASLAIVRSNGFTFGPAANLTSRRREKDVGAPVGNVGRTIEVGAFAQYQAADSIRFRAQLLKGINGHDGLVGTISADKIWRDGDRYVISLGPRVLFSDGRYQRAYFGVTPEASLASGLPTYRPGSGIHEIGVASGASFELNRQWGVFGYARYARLVGDAAKSPIVREFGSRNQLAGGIGLSYTFTVRR